MRQPDHALVCIVESDPHCSTGLSIKAITAGMIDLYGWAKSDAIVKKKVATQKNVTTDSR